MNDIKAAIGTLASTLSLLFDANLKGEHFRLAKFNKGEEDAAAVLWDLLGRLIKGDFCHEYPVNRIKLHFLALNYKSVEFYALPADMSRGSRELLLAFGFLLANGVLSEKIAEEVEKSPFGVAYDVTARNGDRHGSKFSSAGRIAGQLKNEEDFENMLRWIDGKIVLNARMAREYADSVKKMLKKLHEKSEVLSRLDGNVTFSEILALHDAEMCKVFLTESNRIVKIFENYEKWLRKEPLFWKWMSTVIAERDKEKVKKKSVTNHDEEECLKEFIKFAKAQHSL